MIQVKEKEEMNSNYIIMYKWTLTRENKVIQLLAILQFVSKVVLCMFSLWWVLSFTQVDTGDID